jgi:hypothetical protein
LAAAVKETSNRGLMLAGALELSRFGCKVFPVHSICRGTCTCGVRHCGSIAKHPRIRDWQANATADETQIRDWWARWPFANIGLAVGQSGLFVLDVDSRHGGDETLAALEARHGDLPRTWRFLTGGGGVHVLFRDPGAELDLRNSARRLGPGLDTRGRGGFIVAPPSLHASGRRYAVDVDHHLGDVPLADVPQWLIERLARSRSGGKAAAPEEWRALASGIVAKGARNDTIARLAGHLLRRFVDPWVVLAMLQSLNRDRCNPPLDDDEVSVVVASIARREAERRERKHGAA